MMRVQVGSPERAAQVCIEERWLEDPKMLGFGAGMPGELVATEALMGALNMNGPLNQLLGIYDGAIPCGLVWVQYLGDAKKTATGHILISPKYRGRFIFEKSLSMLIDKLFKGGVYRIELEPLKINKRVIKLLRHYGFKQEGIKKSSFWMDDNCYDQVTLRMLRKDWPDSPLSNFTKEVA
jgi:RimJ/RimL family protein N-acetyltransferase